MEHALVGEEWTFSPAPFGRGKAPRTTETEALEMPVEHVAPKIGSPRRRGQRKLAAALAAALVVVAAAFYIIGTKTAPTLTTGTSVAAQSLSAEDLQPVVFHYGFTAGEVRTYVLHVKLNATPKDKHLGAPVSLAMDAQLVYKVVRTMEDGSAVIDIAMKNVHTDGVQGRFLDLGHSTVSVAPDGRLVSTKGQGGVFTALSSGLSSVSPVSSGNPTDSTSSQFLFPQFPSKGLKPGDTWNTDVHTPIPFTNQVVEVSTNGKHDGYTTTSFGKAAKVHQVTTIPVDLSFAFADLAKMVSKQTGQALPTPPGAAGAALAFKGNMQMVSDSLVIPASGDVVKLTGTLTQQLAMSITGITGAPGNIAFDTKMDVSLNRLPAAAP